MRLTFAHIVAPFAGLLLAVAAISYAQPTPTTSTVPVAKDKTSNVITGNIVIGNNTTITTTGNGTITGNFTSPSLGAATATSITSSSNLTLTPGTGDTNRIAFGPLAFIKRRYDGDGLGGGGLRDTVGAPSYLGAGVMGVSNPNDPNEEISFRPYKFGGALYIRNFFDAFEIWMRRSDNGTDVPVLWMSGGARNTVQFRASNDNGSLGIQTPVGNSQPIRIFTETNTALPDRPKNIAFEPEEYLYIDRATGVTPTLPAALKIRSTTDTATGWSNTLPFGALDFESANIGVASFGPRARVSARNLNSIGTLTALDFYAGNASGLITTPMTFDNTGALTVPGGLAAVSASLTTATAATTPFAIASTATGPTNLGIKLLSNSASATATRNWAVVANYGAYGNLAFVQGVNKGDDPIGGNVALNFDATTRNATFGGAISPSGTTLTWSGGPGSPEGVVTAPRGSYYSRTDGGASTTFYVKESGTGNTGWVAK